MNRLMLFASLVAASVAHAAPLELKGIRLGMTTAELNHAFRAGVNTLGIPNPGGLTCWAPEFCTVNIGTLAGIKVMMQVSLVDGVVEDAYASNLLRGDFDTVVEALKAKYGDPTKSTAGTVQNRMGGVFDNPTFEWDMPEGILLAAKHFPGAQKIETSKVEIASRKWMEKKAAVARKANDDL
jgi:hypothetical protein